MPSMPEPTTSVARAEARIFGVSGHARSLAYSFTTKRFCSLPITGVSAHDTLP